MNSDSSKSSESTLQTYTQRQEIQFKEKLANRANSKTETLMMIMRMMMMMMMMMLVVVLGYSQSQLTGRLDSVVLTAC